MIISMTGFGTSKVELPSNAMLCCNIRTLNHKFLDIHISTPHELKQFEAEIMKRLKNSFRRGRLETSFSIEQNQASVQKYEVDFQKAEEYYNLLLSLKKRLDVKGDVDIALLGSIKGIFVDRKTTDIPEEVVLESLIQVLDDSIDKAKVMRAEEGKAIYNDFKKRLKHLNGILDKIKKEALNNIPLYREKIKKCLDSFKGEINVSENRVEQEILLLALRSDIMEECIRLENHASQFETFIEEDKPIGKKLNFLLQEMAREINTLCAKALNCDIQYRGVQIKEEIEYLKEQTYNIE